MTDAWTSRFPAPWRIVEIPRGFAVEDAAGQQLAVLYGRSDPNIAGHTGFLTMDEARQLMATPIVLSYQDKTFTPTPSDIGQWLAFEKVKIKIKRGKKVITITRSVPDPRFLPKGRAKHTFKVSLVEVCNGVVTKKIIKIVFDKHGQVDYKTSDMNGDGIADGKQLTDATGFV